MGGLDSIGVALSALARKLPDGSRRRRGKGAAPVHESLLRSGVIVRPVANYGLPDWLRVTVGLPEENAAFSRRSRARARPIVSSPAPGKLVVVGTGLIGGSFALRAEECRQGRRRGRRRPRTRQSRSGAAPGRSSIGAYTRDEGWTAKLADAALVLLATPVGEMPAAVRRDRAASGTRDDRQRRRQRPSRT